jgi:hypothetical protein
VIAELNRKWTAVCNRQYDNADPDVFKRLQSKLPTARAQALQLDLQHIKNRGSARKANPSSQVYELIATLIGVSSPERCPLDGMWKLVNNTTVTADLKKGDSIPLYSDESWHWRL